MPKVTQTFFGAGVPGTQICQLRGQRSRSPTCQRSRSPEVKIPENDACFVTTGSRPVT